jgi:hypothetical protein
MVRKMLTPKTILRTLLHKIYNDFTGNKLSPYEAMSKAEDSIMELIKKNAETDALEVERLRAQAGPEHDRIVSHLNDTVKRRQEEILKLKERLKLL